MIDVSVRVKKVLSFVIKFFKAFIIIIIIIIDFF